MDTTEYGMDNPTFCQSLYKFYKVFEVCASRSNRNCANNACCLKGLGQQSWITSKTKSLDDQMFNLEIDQPKFRGLKNLGATCYINTFLQLWFHNPTLRQAFYNWRPEDETQSISSNPIMSLQLIFSMMEFSKRPSVNPTPFIKCLELNESLEQDVHEFSYLFISYIQNKLIFDKSIHNTIDQQYCMKMSNIIKCTNCSFISQQKSSLYELPLRVKGFKTIEESIKDFLKEEVLEETNRYDCPVCGDLQIALRYTELRKLPPVLNLQLLRFESSNGHSRKISSLLKFPNRIDMSQFLPQDSSESPSLYNLVAVLIHEGQTSHSGHYISLIKDGSTWFKFNDENVLELTDFNLKIDSDDDFSEGGTSKKGTEKGYHQSKNAYMLVYSAKMDSDFKLSQSMEQSNLPNYVIESINEDNRIYTAQIQEEQEKKKKELCDELAYQNLVKEIHKIIEPNVEEKKFDAIEKEWLIEIFKANNRNSIKPLKNSRLLCSHNKLDMDSSYKFISQESADLIFSNFPTDNVRIKFPMDFCTTCVKYKLELLKIKENVDSDSKKITSLLKFKNESGEKCFWIGKESFKKWKQMRINLFKKKSLPDFNEEIEHFNHDLICEHGNFCVDPSKRRLVSSSIWNIFFNHFPDSQVFHEDYALCNECLLIDQENEILRKKNSGSASLQKSSLSRLYTGDYCLTWDDLLVGQEYHVISTKFYTLWKKFLLHPNTSNSPSCIANDSLICDSHSLFLFPSQQNEFNGFEKKYIIVNDDEWNTLLSFYDCSFYISIIKTADKVIINPEYCELCFKTYVNDEKQKRLVYSKMPIYIHKLVVNEDDQSDSSNENNKKLKTLNENESHETNNYSYLQNCESPRRSLRRRRFKDELEIKVCSTDQLKDVKFKIMQHFNIATFDQHLIFQNKLLLSHYNNMTLAELEIEPNSILVLKVFDRVGENENEDFYQFNFLPECGFKGTQLDSL